MATSYPIEQISGGGVAFSLLPPSIILMHLENALVYRVNLYASYTFPASFWRSIEIEFPGIL